MSCRRSAGTKQINALGYCVGGTLIANALAVLYARGEKPITSLTMLTALLDFEDAGVLDVFIDENQVRLREQQFARGGIMPGLELANTFSSLRANDLVWSYVVSNYLEGKSPPAFDLLYWNGDGTNLPGPMYSWYLRNMYLENNLRVPNKLVTCGQPVDLGPDPGADLCLRGARGPHRAVEGGLCLGACAAGRRQGGRRPLRAGRQRPHRRRDQSAERRTSATTGPDGDDTLPANSDAWFNSAVEHPGQLVAGLEPLAVAPCRCAEACAQALRRREAQADRARAGQLRQGKGMSLVSSLRARRVCVRWSGSIHLHRSLVMTEAVIVAAARTAIGKFGGTLAKVPAPNSALSSSRRSCAARTWRPTRSTKSSSARC